MDDQPVEKVTEIRHSTEEDETMSSIVSEAQGPDIKRWEEAFLQVENQGNMYDLVHAAGYPFYMPKQCEAEWEGNRKRYGWISKDNMESKCDASKLFFYTPVNRNNHPMLPKTAFNKHGGIYREGLYLCWMPYRMWEKRNEVQTKMANLPWQAQEDRAKAEGEGVSHYDPTHGGTRSALSGADQVFQEAEISHPEDSYVEAGEPG